MFCDIIFFSENGNPSHNTILCLLYSLLVYFESSSPVMDKLMTRATDHVVFVVSTSRGREYLMYHRVPVPDFLAVVWFGFSPTPFPTLPSVSSLLLSLPVCCLSSLLTEEGGGRGGSRSQIIRRRESLVLCNYLLLSVQGVMPVSCLCSRSDAGFMPLFKGRGPFLENRFWDCGVHSAQRKLYLRWSLIHSYILGPPPHPTSISWCTHRTKHW